MTLKTSNQTISRINIGLIEMFGIFDDKNAQLMTTETLEDLITKAYGDYDIRFMMRDLVAKVIESQFWMPEIYNAVEFIRDNGMDAFDDLIIEAMTKQVKESIEDGSMKLSDDLTLKMFRHTGFYFEGRYLGLDLDDVVDAWKGDLESEIHDAVYNHFTIGAGDRDAIIDAILDTGRVTDEDLIWQFAKDVRDPCDVIGDRFESEGLVFEICPDVEGMKLEMKNWIFFDLYRVYNSTHPYEELTHSAFFNHTIFTIPEWVRENIGDKVSEAWMSLYLQECKIHETRSKEGLMEAIEEMREDE